jgi:hypothetical protein
MPLESNRSICFLHQKSRPKLFIFLVESPLPAPKIATKADYKFQIFSSQRHGGFV